MNVASITPVPIALTPTAAPRASIRFGRPLAWISSVIPSIHRSSRSSSRVSKSGEGTHSSGCCPSWRPATGVSDQDVAVRRAASAAWRRATAVRSSVVAARTSATGAFAGRRIAPMAPRTRPIPSENKRVIWSAPTKVCHWRRASSRRKVPRATSWRRPSRAVA